MHTFQVLEEAFKVSVKNGFVLTREPLSFDPCHNIIPKNIELLTIHTTTTEKLILLAQTKPTLPVKIIDVTETPKDFSWLAPLQEAVKNDGDCEVLVLSQNNPNNGILGLVNCIRREPNGEKTKCVFLQNNAPNFDLESEFYKNQLKKGFIINVYKDGKWGTYRHLLLENTEQIESEHCVGNVITRGDLSSLSWIEGPIKSNEELPSDMQLIYVSLLLFYCV